jgi:hypothetical protein
VQKWAVRQKSYRPFCIMETMNKYLSNYWETTKHKWWVLWYSLVFCSKLLNRAIRHDLSKYSDAEHCRYADALPRLKKVHYGSLGYKKILSELQPALEHHYSQNSHHPEHHGSYFKMSEMDKIEMLIDWMASARRTPDGDIHRSINISQERFGYLDRDAEWLHRMADIFVPRKKRKQMAIEDELNLMW